MQRLETAKHSDAIREAIRTTGKITIDLSDIDSVAAAISEGLTTPELLADAIDDAELVDDSLVLSPGTWHASDGNAEIEIEADDSVSAAEQYVEDGDWGDRNETTWVSVTAWRQGIDADGDIVQIDRQSHTITIEAEEPDCDHADGHDWQSPYEILGGCKENPGVWGSGGGVKIHAVCMHCGCGRVTDTWAQNPATGEQGLRSVSYEPGKYADEVAAITADESDD